MPRYYFNVVIGDSENHVKDSFGALFTNVDEARKEAVGLARDLAKHQFKGAAKDWKIAVCDHDGQEVLIVRLSEIRWRKLRSWLDFRGPMVKLNLTFDPFKLLAASAMVIVLQMTITMVFNLRQSGNYQTASAPTKDALVAVRFVPHASATEINEFLEAYNASFVGGPQSGGFFRLLIAEKALPQEELTKIVGRIAREKIVDFAAAVQ